MSEEPDKDKKSHSITVGRYVLHRQIARGGMATIHIARLTGDEGFSRIVAAKRLLPEFAEDTEFVSMFMDEARIASKVHHRNVVPVLDLVTTTDEVMLVQEYVHGVPLHVLLRTAVEQNVKIPVRIAVSIAAQVLAGLQAAHTTVDEMGAPLDIIHRDVSPQNVMVATDGSARLLDFGVAKTTIAAHVTRDGTFKGKLAYSAPEQVRGKPVQQSDIYSLSVVLWELLVGHRMHGSSQGEAELVATILNGSMPTITEALSNEADWGAIDSDEWKCLAEIDPIVQKGLSVDAEQRFATAGEMEAALNKACPPASASEIAAWVKKLGKDFLEGRDKIIAAEEASWRKSQPQGSRRLTPVPGSLQRSNTLSTNRGSVSTVNTHVTMPQAPSEGRGLRMIIGVLGALVLLLGVGVVFAVQASDDPPPPLRDEPRGDETTVQKSAASPAPLAEARSAAAPSSSIEPAPASVVEAPAVPTPSAGEEAQAPESGAVASDPASAKVPVPAAKRTRVKRVGRIEPELAAPAPAPAAPDPPPAAAAAPLADDARASCNPPYYYEGQKKVFKPHCL
jgi:serine/threonine-protein kinase